ncbi:MAG: PqqD family protein [Usitatibacter sp.]
MSSTFRGRVTVPEGVLVRELGGESVLLNLRSESYFGLDDVGTRMWAALTASPSMEDAYRMLADEYEVEPALLRADLSTFVEKLSAAGLIHVAED